MARDRRNADTEPTRFAHPFFDNQPPEERPANLSPYGRRMTDFTKDRLQPIPVPTRNPVMDLADIIGKKSVKEIEDYGSISFHSVGDTGVGVDSPQEAVADAMNEDFNIKHPERCPVFFFHLGDIIYGGDKDRKYRDQFYDPYRQYTGKIIAIPGNHDGEVFPKTDPETLRGFLANFCASKTVVPAIAGTIYRDTMRQPGVYWLLDAPFLQIIGLYSNVAENPGFISGKIPGDHQKKWLVKTLKAIRKQRDGGSRKALIIAAHHPPYSQSGHTGSSAMLKDIDDAFTQAGILPDAFFAAHSHTQQRYTRYQTLDGEEHEIPYIVCGCGGKGDKPVSKADKKREKDVSYDHSYRGYGYLLVKADAEELKINFISVSKQGKRDQEDSVTVDLKSGKLK